MTRDEIYREVTNGGTKFGPNRVMYLVFIAMMGFGIFTRGCDLNRSLLLAAIFIPLIAFMVYSGEKTVVLREDGFDICRFSRKNSYNYGEITQIKHNKYMRYIKIYANNKVIFFGSSEIVFDYGNLLLALAVKSQNAKIDKSIEGEIIKLEKISAIQA